MLSGSPTKTLNHDWVALSRAVVMSYSGSDLRKAEDICWDSLAKAKLMGEFEPRLAISLSNLAVLQRLGGRREKAEDLSNIALRILQAIDSRGELMITALSNAAVFFHDEGRLGEARRLFGKSISLAEMAFMEPVLAKLLCLFARLCTDQAKYSQAETLLKRVATLEPGGDETRMLYQLTRANNSIQQGRLTKGEQALEEAELLFDQVDSLGAFWKSSLLSLRGDLGREQYLASQKVSGSGTQDFKSKREQAVDSYSQALEIREQLLGPFHSSCGVLYRKQASFFFELSEYALCESNLRKGLSISLSSRGAYHLETQQCLELSGLLMRATSRHDEAEEMESRAVHVEKRVRQISRETYVIWGQSEEDGEH